MFGFAKLESILGTYLDEDKLCSIRKAYEVAKSAHANQFRYTGEAYITHPVAVATILAKMKLDSQSIMAAILHDVIEDTPLDKEYIENNFGAKVAELVDGVSKLNHIKFESKTVENAENFRKMFLAMANDIRVIVVKLADRLHNMRTLATLPPKKRRRIARDTLDIYAPIAYRLGMRELHLELEELGFLNLYPLRYKILEKALGKASRRKEMQLKLAEQKLKEALCSKLSNAKVMWRKKHLYSIYKKMQDKRLSFFEILDLYGFRIIVNALEDCYACLGMVHSLYKPMPKKFKDYIALPKHNGYQALHTTVVIAEIGPVEVQIKTKDMYELAEAGVASHWMYKNNLIYAEQSKPKLEKWLESLLDIQDKVSSPLDYIENVKLDLFSEEIYVLTPRGDIITLPNGSTPIDFAYAVHTYLGDRCVACRINNNIAPLTSRLLNGQTVEIITMSEASPNEAWLNYVVTGKARSSIKHWVKDREETQMRSLGVELLERQLAKIGKNMQEVSDLISSEAFLCETFDNISNKESLLEKIGFGELNAELVVYKLFRQGEPVAKELQHKVTIKGTEGLAINYAECCHPIPNDQILGVLNLHKGITAHRDSCKVLRASRNLLEKAIVMDWQDEVEGSFKAKIDMDVTDRPGLLAEASFIIFKADANIDSVQLSRVDSCNMFIQMVLEVSHSRHLNEILKELSKIQGMLRLGRVESEHVSNRT